jgi:2-methylisocitrate lyase-like PEP mutase family enzyme
VKPAAQPVSHDVAADAKALRALHVAGTPLLLANVWDPPTARVVESAGMRAIATASAAVAPVNGYADHGKIPPDAAFGALRRIVDAVALPVTADLEDGYGLSAEDLAALVIDAGACGLNLEDTDHAVNALIDADKQAERIAAIKTAARARDVDLVVNARIDVHLHGRPAAEGLQRARKYFDAGADCVYPILLSEVSAIRAYVAMGPTNVLWRVGGPRLGALAEADVSRISVGPLLHHLTLKHLRIATDALRRFADETVWT